MELVASTGQVHVMSNNGTLTIDSSNVIVEEGPCLEGLNEGLLEDFPNERLSEEVLEKSLLEEMPIEGHLSEEYVLNKSHPEAVPGHSLPIESISFEVSSKSFNDEVLHTIVTEVPSTVVVEETSNGDLSQRTVNSSFEIPASEVLLNGTEESNASRESEHVPGVGMVGQKATEVQTNGGKLEVYDASILLPPWNRARVPGSTIAISDMRGVDSLNYSKAEKLLRCKLAAAYRLIDIFGWSDGVNASISALTNSGDVLVAPLGILHHEVTSSSLVKLSLGGDVIDPGSTGLAVDTDDLTLHAAIYRSRHDIRCIMRFSSPIVVAFSTLKCGLLPLCPEAMEIGNITYTDYFGAIYTEEDEVPLGLVQHQNSKVMFLRNFGLVVCGDSVEQAFDVALNAHVAIETQFKILSVGLANLYIPSEEKQRTILETTSECPPDVHPSRIDRRLEDVRFEGFMRMLDGAGYQTGYTYRFPMASKRTVRSQSLMEMTHSTKSAVSDAIRVHDESLPVSGESSRCATPSSRRPASVMNTKSVTEDSQSCRKSHRFVPLGTDVREYKQKVKEIRKEFLPRHASAGPHSTVLEGVTWDEAKRIQESQSNSGGGGIRVTAASRGIIQRDHQKSAIFFKEFSAGNPFDAVSRKELDDYVHEVHRKTASPVPPSTLPAVPELENISVAKQESVKEPRQQEKRKAEQEKNKTNTEPLSIRVAAVDQTLKIEVGYQPKHELQDVTHPTNKDKGPVVEPHAFAEKQEHLNAGRSAQQDVSPVHKFEKPVTPTVGVVAGVQAPVKQEKTEPAKQELKPTQEASHSKSHESSHEASKSGKLKKSQSVMEGDTNKLDASPKESGMEDVELRTKDKKKKRGLSAIFSKKKDK